MNADEYIRTIGQNIVKQRVSKGIRQVDLANLLNMDDSTLRRLETGKTNPTVKTLHRIALVLEIDVADLFKV
jgi:transcriptional regulator with XRE-family HTH domain